MKENLKTKNLNGINFNNINIGINNNNFIIDNNIKNFSQTYSGPFKTTLAKLSTNINNYLNKDKTINNNNKSLVNKKTKSESSKYIFKTEENNKLYNNYLIEHNDNYIINKDNYYENKSRNEQYLSKNKDLDNVQKKITELLNYLNVNKNDTNEKRNYNSLDNKNTQRIYIKKNCKNYKNLQYNDKDKSLKLKDLIENNNYNNDSNLNLINNKKEKEKENDIYIHKNNYLEKEINNNNINIKENNTIKNDYSLQNNLENIKNRVTNLLGIYSYLLHNKINIK